MKSKLQFTAILIVILLLSSFMSYSQDSGNSDTDNSVTSNYSYFMVNASYTNNNLEYLTGVTEKIPTLFTNLSYFHKTGFYLGGAYANYFNTSVQTYEYDIEAGYQKYFDNGLDIDFYYVNHNFSGDSLLEGLNYDHSLNFSSGIDIGKFYLSADLSYLISGKNNYFTNINFSRFITIDKLFFKNDIILINPSISLNFGTDYWIYSNMTDTEKQQLSASLSSAGYSFESFSYEGFDFLLPVSYGIKNTYLTFSWLYRIPGDKYKFLGWENQSGFMFSLTYFLNFANTK